MKGNHVVWFEERLGDRLGFEQAMGNGTYRMAAQAGRGWVYRQAAEFGVPWAQLGNGGSRSEAPSATASAVGFGAVGHVCNELEGSAAMQQGRVGHACPCAVACNIMCCALTLACFGHCCGSAGMSGAGTPHMTR